MRQIIAKTSKLSEITVDSDLTMGSYDIVLGASKLKTTNMLIKEIGTTDMAFRNIGDTGYAGIKTNYLTCYGTISLGISGGLIMAINSDDAYGLLKARDNGSGLLEVARLVGAADPYFQATLPMVLNPSSVPGTPVEGHFWYDATADKLKFRDASATQTIPTGDAKIATGTYTGDGTDNRQITVGFACKWVFVGETGNPMDFRATCDTAKGAGISGSSASNNWTDCILHATDGFVVDSTYMNGNGLSYSYLAIG